MAIQNQIDPVKFICQLSKSVWPKTSLPQWAKAALSLPKKEHPEKQIKQEIKAIQDLVVNNLSRLSQFEKDVQGLNRRLKMLKRSIKDTSKEQINQKIAKIKLHSDFNVETVFDQLNDAIEKKHDAKILRCYHFIFDHNQLNAILSQQGKKYPTLVIEILKRAFDHANYDEVKYCLAFIQENQLHEYLKEMPGLEKLFNIKEIADFALVVSHENAQETIYVNAAVLAMRSPYFSGFFGSHWASRGKEGLTKEMKIVGQVVSLKELVRYFYTKEMNLTSEILEDIMRKAHEWELSEALKLCEEWCLKTYNMNSQKVLQIYQSVDPVYCDAGILNTAVREILLKNLSPENYAAIFTLAEAKNDSHLQEKILNHLTKCLLATTSIDPKVKNFAFNAKDEQNITQFLKEKGPLLKRLEGFNFCPFNKSFVWLQTIVQLFPNLSSLDLSEKWPSLSLKEMRELTKLQGLKELHFRGCSDFRGLMDLAAFKELEVLTIRGQNFDPTMEGVRELYQSLLANGKITGETLPLDLARTSLSCLFSEIENLKKLDLTFCKGVQYVLPALKHNPEIKELVLSLSDLDDSSAEDIAAILSLEKLYMASCKETTVSFLEKISQSLSNLKELDMRGAINGKDVILGKSLKKFKKLEKLSIENLWDIKNAYQLNGIEEISTLTDLSLRGYNIIDCSYSVLKQLLSVQKLSISGHVSDECIEIISKLPNLQQLMICNFGSITPSSKSWKFFPQMTNLRNLTLQINSVEFLKNGLFEALSNLKNMTNLNLRATDEESVYLGGPTCGISIAKMTKLQELYIDGFSNFRNDFIASISKLPLKKLSLKNTSIDSKATEDLMKLTHLTSLTLPKSFKLAEDSPLLSNLNLSVEITDW